MSFKGARGDNEEEGGMQRGLDCLWEEKENEDQEQGVWRGEVEEGKGPREHCMERTPAGTEVSRGHHARTKEGATPGNWMKRK